MRTLPPPVAALVALILFLGLPSDAPSQEGSAVPAWISFERAEEASREGPGRDYAEALRLYSQALAAQPLYPEAHAGIARIYRTEGDITMARRHYERALEQSQALQIPDEEYALRIELAEMHLQTGATEAYRNALQRVINRDPVFAGIDGSRQREAMRDRLLDSGLNRVLTLYRLDFPQSLEAHRHYADYLLQQGSKEDTAVAVEHLLFAVVEIAGRAVDAIIDREFDYQFTSIADLLLTARRFPEVQRYLDESDFLGLLLQLAAALDETEAPGAPVAAGGIRRDLQAALSLQR
jgi:tetratricopeptide (TPR) repeat protein